MKDRLQELINKLLSIKGIFFIGCLILTFMGKLNGEYFFLSGLFVIGDRTLEKWLKIINGKNNNAKGE